MNENNHKMSMPTGISLLLVVFVLLTMLTFGTLSYVTAQTDLTFSESNAQITKEYYAADILAKKTLQSIDEQLNAIDAEDIDTYYDEVELQLSSYQLTREDNRLLLYFDTPVNANETLNSCIEVLFNDTQNFKIVSWNLSYHDDWVTDESIDVFTR